jgi:hypothetical protein
MLSNPERSLRLRLREENMCRRIPCLLIVAIVVAVVVTLHHARQSHTTRTVAVDMQRDPAVALRQMTHTSAPDKQWITAGDQSDFHTRLLVGRSRKPATSEQEALRDARRDVESRVLAVVDNQIVARREDRGFLAERVASDVFAGRFEVDRIAEKFNRPYGRVWTESVLVDLSPGKLQPAIAGYQQEIRSHRNKVHARWAGFAALAALIMLGYGLSNMLTRGYFTGRLRIMTLVVLVLGAFALI